MVIDIVRIILPKISYYIKKIFFILYKNKKIMPCLECENGLWRFGESGKCQYSSKSECESANADYYAEETYDDYPQAATNNAKRAIKYKEENGSSCGTNVGWTRAGQLSRREKLSRSTIARMASFKRHQQHKDVPYDEGCGGLMWDAWGGTSGIEWAIKKLEQIDKKKDMAKKKRYYSDEEHDHHFHFTQEMMETLHTEGELEVKVEEGGKEMLILFTFDNEDKEIIVDKSNDEVILSMLDDELDEYIDKLASSIKQL